MSLYVGIDYSTFEAHLVAIDEESSWPEWYEVVRFSGPASFHRLRVVRTSLLEQRIFGYDDVLAVGIEDPRATNPLLRSMIAKLARVQGAILQAIPASVRVEPLNAKEWRVAVGLSGNAPKDVVAEWAENELPRNALGPNPPQDAYDAYALARATQEFVEGRWTRPLKAKKKKATTKGDGG